MNSSLPIRAALVFGLLSCCVTLAQGPIGKRIPTLEGETLAGGTAKLPNDFKGSEALLIVTFSRHAGEEARTLMGRQSVQGFATYSAAFLESVPRLLRGLVRSSIRSSVPDPLKPRFLIVVKDEESWKSFVGVKDAQLPCALIVTRDAAVSFSMCDTEANLDRALAERKKKK